MIDHVSVAVSDLACSTAFYDAVFAPIGLARLVTRERSVGYGKTYPEFWINLREGYQPPPGDPGTHICLRTRGEASVIAFHAAALAHDGEDSGAPGPRQAAMTTYFGAFILDPDRNKIEVLTFPNAS
ncbi:MAG: VOC family protein [Phreatobacter sp.]|uniref:VOC family protein n=1 Tax=Phreatobacter sp. TaxID=1966341 RepID=UPI001A60D59D|nr:VOC family protein [Phreatobacter sp.]MBL8568923.1 VOC family protein [Phreatobacter sp.]